MREKITDRAKGRWKGILAAVGVPGDLTNGKHHPCPFCGGRDRFRFTDYNGTGGYICSQCGNGSGFDFLMKLKGWDFKEAAREVEKVIGSCGEDVKSPERSEADKRAAMNKLWRAAKPITTRDPVGVYLARRCGLTEFPAALRYVPALHYTGATTDYPAMIAKLTGPDSKPSNIHRTYLTTDGRKAPVEAPRRMMPGAIAKGAAVRLAPPAAAMGIAEGIETALSAMALFNVPTWAALNAEMLKAWQPPAGVLRVSIYGDNDANFTGQAAAFALAKRLSVEGIVAEIKIPEKIGDDWNDVHSRMHATKSAA
jgi:putative DNA primase/helicase